jgi:hypothetical protein
MLSSFFWIYLMTPCHMTFYLWSLTKYPSDCSENSCWMKTSPVKQLNHLCLRRALEIYFLNLFFEIFLTNFGFLPQSVPILELFFFQFFDGLDIFMILNLFLDSFSKYIFYKLWFLFHAFFFFRNFFFFFDLFQHIHYSLVERKLLEWSN